MEKMPLNNDVFKYYGPDDVTELFHNNGNLKDITNVSEKGAQKTGFCAIAVK